VLVGGPIAMENAGELARTLAAWADPVRPRLLSLVAGRTAGCSCALHALAADADLDDRSA